MIQRIQTLLLAVAAIAAIVVNFMPIGDIVNTATNQNLYQYDAFSLKIFDNGAVGQGIVSTVYIALLWFLSAILSIVSIFMYKKRQRQIMLNSINMIVMLAALVVMLYIYPNIVFNNTYITNIAILNFNHWILISLIPAAAIFFANSAIKKDEKKVRAADRLR